MSRLAPHGTVQTEANPAKVRGDSVGEVRGRLQSLLDGFLARSGPIRVLEAGCGSLSHVKLGTESHIVGIDISQQQLEKNATVDERILGDIQTYALRENNFDVVICWEVLEHVQHPLRALANLTRSLKPQGILILAFPNVFSLKGLITKFTPYRFHVWVHRSILGHPEAGTKGNAPFPTPLRLSMAPDSIGRFGHHRGFQLVYLGLYEGRQQHRVRERLRIRGLPWTFVKNAVDFVTLGKVSADLSDCIIVLRKAGGPVATPAQPVGSPPRESAEFQS